MRILTTTTKPNYPAWGEHTEMLEGWLERVQRVWNRKSPSFLSDLQWAFRFLFASKSFDAVITGFERSAWLFALLRRLTFRRRPTHIFLDAYPVLPENGMLRRLGIEIFRQVFLSADCVVVFSKKQRELWSSLFRVPSSRFEVIPYWATAASDVEFTVEPVLGDYIFAGGDEDRDYRTLIEAVRGLPYQLIIAAVRRDHFEGITIPPNVSIRAVPHDEFVSLLSAAALVVVPLRDSTIRFAGQQTYLNAMLMQKPVIVADAGAEEYIKNGRTGVIVNPGSEQELADAIDRLMRNREQARQMGLLAQQAAKQFTADRYFGNILAKARACADTRGLDISPA